MPKDEIDYTYYPVIVTDRWRAQEKEIARLHKIIELIFFYRFLPDAARYYNMFRDDVDENGMVCDCCECAPCICEGDDRNAGP